jgi:hypothetical protein
VLKAGQLIQRDPVAVERVVRQQFPDSSEAFVKAYRRSGAAPFASKLMQAFFSMDGGSARISRRVSPT